VNKLVPATSLLLGALETWSLRLRYYYDCDVWNGGHSGVGLLVVSV